MVSPIGIEETSVGEKDILGGSTRSDIPHDQTTVIEWLVGANSDVS